MAVKREIVGYGEDMEAAIEDALQTYAPALEGAKHFRVKEDDVTRNGLKVMHKVTLEVK